MEPPAIPGSDKYETNASFSRWKKIAIFDGPKQCGAFRKELSRKMATATLPSPEELRKYGIAPKDWIAGQLSGLNEFARMRCIGSGDPRLRDK